MMVTMVHSGWRIPNKSTPDGPKRRKEIDRVLTSRGQGSSDDPKKTKEPVSDSRTFFYGATRNFEFINTTEYSHIKDKELARRIKSHVAQGDPLRKKRQASQKPNELFDTQSVAPQIEQEANDRTHPVVQMSLNKEGKPETGRYLDSEHGPFRSLTIIRYFVEASRVMYPRETAFKFNPVNPNGFFQYAINDGTLTHSLLYVSVAYYGLLKGQKDSQQISGQMTKAVRLVNARMKNPQLAVADATIAAIAILACAEYIRGNFSAWALHMKGLKTIVDMRGGINSLDRLLRLKVLRCDIGGAVESVHKPYFEFMMVTRGALYADQLKLRRLDDGLISEMINAYIDATIIKAYQDLGNLTRVLDYALRSDHISLNLLDFGEECSSIQYSLISFSSSKNQLGDRSMEEALKFGALLFLKAVLKEFPSSVTGSDALILGLKKSLSQVVDFKKLAPFIFWVSFVGCASSRVAEHRSWFLRHLVDMSILLELTSWDDVRDSLTVFPWIGAIHDVSFGNIWEEATAIRSGLKSNSRMEKKITLI